MGATSVGILTTENQWGTSRLGLVWREHLYASLAKRTLSNRPSARAHRTPIDSGIRYVPSVGAVSTRLKMEADDGNAEYPNGH